MGLNPRRLNGSSVALGIFPGARACPHSAYDCPGGHRCCVTNVESWCDQQQIARSERNQADDCNGTYAQGQLGWVQQKAASKTCLSQVPRL